MASALDLFEGAITASGFSSGDAVVVGCWARSPLGRVVDVMWRQPDGTRVLLAPTRQTADYVAGLYRFDRVHVTAIGGGISGDRVDVTAALPAVEDRAGRGGPSTLRLRATLAAPDWRSWLFALRPRALRRSPAWVRVEDRLARPIVGLLLGGGDGVRAAGEAPGGQQEFYGVDDWRPLLNARLEVGGVDQGAMCDLPAELGVGLSAFPTRPASVRVGTMIAQPQPGKAR